MTATRFEGGVELLPGEKVPQNVPPMIELGATGLRRTSGYIDDEFLPQLRGRQAVKVYREMSDNDPIVGALLFAVDRLLRQVTWRVEPASNSSEDTQASEFVEQCMEDMSHTWDDFLSEILTMLPYGWSWHEIVYKKRQGPWEKDPRKRSKFSDGKIGWRKIPIRAQETLHRWLFDETGGIQGMVQIPPPRYTAITLPIEKCLLFRSSTIKGNPEGRSFLRNAYRPWYMKKRLEEVEGIGVERDLAGLPMGKVPAEYLNPKASVQQKQMVDAFRKMVRAVRRDEQEGIIVPTAYDQDTKQPLFDFQLLTSGGSRQFDTNAIIQRYEQRILMSVLADFIMVGHQGTGSYALHTDKSGLFRASINSISQSIAEVMNRYAIPRLFALNGWKLDTLPKIVPNDVDPPDLTQLSQFMGQMTAAGVQWFPDPELEKFLRDAARLPKLDDVDEKVRETEARQAQIMRLATQKLQMIQMSQQAQQGAMGLQQQQQGIEQQGQQDPRAMAEQEMGQKSELHQMTLAEKQQAMSQRDDEHKFNLKAKEEQHKQSLQSASEQHRFGLQSSTEKHKQGLKANELATRQKLGAESEKTKLTLKQLKDRAKAKGKK